MAISSQAGRKTFTLQTVLARNERTEDAKHANGSGFAACRCHLQDQ
jgi:hypothetical protein